MDAVATSFLLSCWHRERGEFSLEEAVHLLTAKQARVIGLHDRGVLAIGNKADINVIDIENLADRQPMRVHGFPGGASRFVHRASGY